MGQAVGDRDSLARMAMAFNTMRRRPDPGLAARMGSLIDQRRQQAEGARVSAAQDEQRNMTVEWLRRNGMEREAELFQLGLISPSDLGGMLTAGGPEYTQMTGAQLAERLNMDPSLVDQGAMYNVGRDGKITAIGGGGVSVNLPSQPQVAGDYMLVPDPQAETGYRYEVIPGSETWREMQDAEEQSATKDTRQEVTTSVMLDDINRAIAAMDGTLPATGGWSALRIVPGTAADKLENALASLEPNIAFQQLQQMRDSSPTGGAVGQLTDNERKALSSVLGSLRQSQTESELRYNLERLRTITLDTAHGAGNWRLLPDGRVAVGEGIGRAQGGDATAPAGWENIGGGVMIRRVD